MICRSPWRTQRRIHRSRSGAALVAVMVCLLIVMSLLGSMLLGTMRARRQLHVERDLRQCELLLRAGVERGALRMSQDVNYQGEMWTMPAAAILGTGEGRVTIEIAQPAAENTPRKLYVIAEYPLGNETSIRRSRTVAIPSQIPPP